MQNLVLGPEYAMLTTSAVSIASKSVEQHNLTADGKYMHT